MNNKDNKTKRMNWRIIAANLREARRQLEDIERQIEKKKYPHEGALQVFLEHAYHHLNFAWNIRKTTVSEYKNMSDEDFNRWSRFPKDIELPKLDIKRSKKSAAIKQSGKGKSKE